MEKHLWKVFADSYMGEIKVVTSTKSISEVEIVCEEHEVYDVETIQYIGEVLT